MDLTTTSPDWHAATDSPAGHDVGTGLRVIVHAAGVAARLVQRGRTL